MMTRITLLACLLAPAANAQIADTLLTWRMYAHEAVAHVQLHHSADQARPVTALIDEVASNHGAPATDDARFLAETVGRLYGRDPVEMTFVFRFTPNSFCEDARGGKTLLLRATFSRTQAGALATPNWRVITRDELARLTDRAVY